MHYASVGRRFGAMILDAVIMMLPSLVIHFILPFSWLILALFYYPVLESSRLRATIGKKLMGIEVSAENGEALSFGSAVLRFFMKLLSSACMFLGHFLVFFTEKKQAFHDLVSGSVVVYGRREVAVVDAWLEQARRIFGSA
jgi:uncharacterized RDD family membrane protein YckC